MAWQINWGGTKKFGLRRLVDMNWEKFDQQIFIYGFHPTDDMMDAEGMRYVAYASLDSVVSEAYIRLPHGLCCQLIRADSKMSLTAWEEANWSRLPRHFIYYNSRVLNTFDLCQV